MVKWFIIKYSKMQDKKRSYQIIYLKVKINYFEFYLKV